MAQYSLKRITIDMQPVKAYVKSCMHSEKKYNVFCLVEAPFDMRIYTERLSEQIDVRVAYADNDKHTHSRDTVEKFVCELRTEVENVRVIGIRDVDYSEYLSHQMPVGIYGTDDRDLEMTILHSPSFTAYLKAVIPDYDNVMKDCLAACRCLGYIRIFDEYIGRKCRINKKVKISNVYDCQHYKYQEFYEETLKRLYISFCEATVTEDDIDNYRQTQRLDYESDYRVCRGHDVLPLLGIVLGNQFHEPEMHKQMEKHYSKEDFYCTSLFNEIQNYCTAFGIVAKPSVFQ